MSFLAPETDERIKNVSFSEDSLSVDLLDGRSISVPLVWYPRLMNATNEQKLNWKISGGGFGINWADLDEDLSVHGLLKGIPSAESKE